MYVLHWLELGPHLAARDPETVASLCVQGHKEEAVSGMNIVMLWR